MMLSLKRYAQKWSVGLLLLLSAPAWAATLTDVSFSSLPGDRVNITLTLDEAIDTPASFSTDNPARIAIDLPNTRSALAQKVTPVAVGVARSVTAIEAADRTRVVINLVAAADHEVKAEGNKVTINIGGDAGATTLRAPIAAQVQPGKAGSVDKIDFRRGADGEGRVEIALSSSDIVVDMRQQGERIELEMRDTSLPDALARTLDVTDFATPVTEIQTRPDGPNTRLSIRTQGDFEHLAYQSENLYTIEFRPLTRAQIEQQRRDQQVFEGERLSLNFQDIEVRAVLQLLADFTGLNMVVSDSVSGRITLRLKNVPWDQAMDIILKTRGLSMRRNDNVILIAPTEEIAAREKLELESEKQIEELAPLRSELIQVNYAKAGDLAALLKGAENKLLSERGNVTIDERTNALLVQDTAAKLSEIRALIEQLDIPVRQVLIESRIVVADNDFGRDLGVKLGYTDQANSGDYSLDVSGGINDGTNDFLVNLPVASPSSAVNLVLGKLGSELLRLELSAMQTEGKGEIISSPRVITSNQSTATIKTGSQIPYQEASSSGATSVSFVEAVLSLEVTPQITPDDRVIMELKVNKDSPVTITGASDVGIDTNELQTTVLVDNGETVVLGGVFEREKSKDIGRVPFFGDLPYVGWAFKQENIVDNNSELLIFVTPKILKDSLTLR